MALRSRALLIPAVLIAAVLAFALGAALALRASAPPSVPGLLWPARTIAPFTLTDRHGQPFTLAALEGRWSFVYFGFTRCPDVCPTTLGLLKQVGQKLVDDAAFLQHGQVVLVSVDPERDTPAALDRYLGYFGPSFTGVTGRAADIAAVAREFGVVFGRVPQGDDYTVDHSASVLLVDPHGRLVAVFTPPIDSGRIAEQFRAIRAFVEAQS